tara:strand:+ start:304 stop:600 length:297 start_codon:yes stop_codon:yes gene_type:complete
MGLTWSDERVYNRKSEAKVLTMKYYFNNPDWFDKAGLVSENKTKGQTRLNKVIQPKKCTKCNKVYQRAIRQDYHKITYLNRAVFDGVRIIKETCYGCK